MGRIQDIKTLDGQMRNISRFFQVIKPINELFCLMSYLHHTPLVEKHDLLVQTKTS